MRSIDLLLDKAREKCERPSDRALAEKLRVTASAVSKWRKGGVITEMHATALAAIAGLDGEIVVRVMEEQAETPAQRRVWRSVLDRLSAAAAVLMLVVFAAPGAARAKAIDSQGFSGSGQPHSVYYVLSRIATQATGAFPTLRSQSLTLGHLAHSIPAALIVKRNPQDLPIISRTGDARLQHSAIPPVLDARWKVILRVLEHHPVRAMVGNDECRRRHAIGLHMQASRFACRHQAHVLE